MLRRTQNIVFKDDFPTKDTVPPKPAAAAPRFDRQYPDALRFEDELSAPPKVAERRGLDALRAEAQRSTVIISDDDVARTISISGAIRNALGSRRGIMIVVAMAAAGLAAYFATQLVEPAPPPVVVETVVEAPAPVAQVLVAKQSIAVGQRVSASTLEWIDWPEAALRPEYVTAAATPEAITEMSGAVARDDILPGEPIRPDKLLQTEGGYLSAVLDSGMRGVSVTVSAASASGGFVVPNDRVDVVSTHTAGTTLTSVTILENVRILAINSQLGSASRDNPDLVPEAFSDVALATLELNRAQAEIVITAATNSQLTLVLRSAADFEDVGKSEHGPDNQAIRLSSPFWAR